ncbi:MAG: hypothetical protein M0R39_16820 [Prolixibacteraceae bacterium]|nr:hypothetical protein [Prolixibacteraceae bacterium]
MKLEFEYTVKFETQRVKGTIEQGDWFKQFNYRLFFPDGFNLDSNDLSNLKKQITKEFDVEKINKIFKDINESWLEFGKPIKSLIESVPYEAPDSLKILFTKYGVGGSYWPPDRVIVNVSYDWLDYFETVMHELVHILIEKPVIQKYKIKHESKEALVDYIFTHNKYLKLMFPNYPVQKMFINELPDKKLMDRLTWI